MPIALRLYRLSLLIAAVALLRATVPPRGSVLGVERVRDFFPAAERLGEPDASSGQQVVLDKAGTLLGRVAQTSPLSDRIIGYSGPTNTLIASDPSGLVLGIRILHSDDTPEHVAEVVAERSFFAQFKTLRLGHSASSVTRLDGVSGATLTSTAIADAVLARLGQKDSPGSSRRFPAAITLEEVQSLEPLAASLRPLSDQPGASEVLDASGQVIARALRTAPVADDVIGYKGPSDTLLLLDATGQSVRAVKLRRSYDTPRYVGYITGDSYFLGLFKAMPLSKLATLDFDQAKLEGVSGATETSWAIAEGLKRRAAAQLAPVETNPEPTLRHHLQALLPQRWRWQDSGHVALLVSALLMALTKLRGIAWLRHGYHALLFIYSGCFAGEMLSQALFIGWARHGVPWQSASGLVLLGVIALASPLFTRRQLYCHHLCPHGAAQQLLANRLPWQWRVSANWLRWLERLPFALLAVVIASMVWRLPMNLNAIEPFDAYSWRVAGIATLVIAVVGLVASMFVPLAYCRFGCPTGALFKLLRFTGDQDRFGTRDWLALALLAALALGRWLA